MTDAGGPVHAARRSWKLSTPPSRSRRTTGPLPFAGSAGATMSRAPTTRARRTPANAAAGTGGRRSGVMVRRTLVVIRSLRSVLARAPTSHSRTWPGARNSSRSPPRPDAPATPRIARSDPAHPLSGAPGNLHCSACFRSSTGFSTAKCRRAWSSSPRCGSPDSHLARCGGRPDVAGDEWRCSCADLPVRRSSARVERPVARRTATSPTALAAGNARRAANDAVTKPRRNE